MDEAPARHTETDWASAWAAALDDLELTLDRTERLLHGEDPDGGTTIAPWAAPALEGPMPLDLRTRALALHHRQLQVLRAATEASAALRRQAALTSRMSTGSSEPRPVYLDITA